MVFRIKCFFLALLLVGCGAQADCDAAGSETCAAEDAEVAEQPEWPSVYGSQLELDDEAAEFFNRPELLRIELSLSPERWGYLHQNARMLDATTTFLAVDVNIDGTELGSVGMRPKGAHGTLLGCTRTTADEGDVEQIVVKLQEFSGVTCPKLSYKLKFDKYQKGLRFRGLERLNLHSMIRDRSKMREFLSYGIFRRMGIAAPRVNYAELYVNGEHLGLFAMVEEIDEAFLRSRFPEGSEGNLYKDVWITGATSREFDEGLRTNEDDPDHTGLLRATAEFEEASDESLPEVFSHWMDEERFVNFIEVEQAMLNWDGPLTFRHKTSEPRSAYRNHNFYLYQPTPTSKFRFIPWDMDNSLRGIHLRIDGRPDYQDLTIDCDKEGFLKGYSGDRFYMAPSCDPLVRAAALSGLSENRERLLERVFTSGKMNELMDWLETRLEGAVRRDRTLKVSDWRDSVQEQRDAIQVLVKRAASFRATTEVTSEEL